MCIYLTVTMILQLPIGVVILTFTIIRLQRGIIILGSPIRTIIQDGMIRGIVAVGMRRLTLSVGRGAFIMHIGAFHGIGVGAVGIPAGDFHIIPTIITRIILIGDGMVLITLIIILALFILREAEVPLSARREAVRWAIHRCVLRRMWEAATKVRSTGPIRYRVPHVAVR